MARRLQIVRLASSAAVALAVAASGCGYTVIRAAPPFGLGRMVVIPFLEDDPVGIAPELATDLAERLAAAGVTLTTERTTADAVLTGRILNVRTVNAPVASPASPIRMYRVYLTLIATLTRGTTEMWRQQIDVSDDFLPGAPTTPVPDQKLPEPAFDLATEANRRQALHRISRAAAQSLAELLFVASATSPGGPVAPSPAPPAKTAPPAKQPGASATPAPSQPASASPASPTPAQPAQPPAASPAPTPTQPAQPPAASPAPVPSEPAQPPGAS